MMDALVALENSGFGIWLRESPSIWAYPLVLTLHTLGLAVLVGGNAVLDLRLLGAGLRIPIEPLRRLFPIMWLGFWVNALSGVALFVADASTKGTTTIFIWKMVFIAAGVAVLFALKRLVYGNGEASDTASGVVKGLAVASLALWVLAIITGRYTAYVIF